jgi:hypothetical protein
MGRKNQGLKDNTNIYTDRFQNKYMLFALVFYFRAAAAAAESADFALDGAPSELLKPNPATAAAEVAVPVFGAAVGGASFI